MGAEGKFVTRDASKFQLNDDNVTPPCVDATHVGLFNSVVQSAVGALGKFVTRDASMFPLNEDNVTPPCVDVTHAGLFARLSHVDGGP